MTSLDASILLNGMPFDILVISTRPGKGKVTIFESIIIRPFFPKGRGVSKHRQTVVGT